MEEAALVAQIKDLLHTLKAQGVNAEAVHSRTLSATQLPGLVEVLEAKGILTKADINLACLRLQHDMLQQIVDQVIAARGPQIEPGLLSISRMQRPAVS